MVDASIAGVGESDIGVTHKTVLELQEQAISRALADAGLSLRDVDGLATSGVSRFSTTALADYLGLRPSWCESTFVGGSAAEMYIGRAAQAIQSGQCSTVVISYANNQQSRRTTSLAGFIEVTPEAQFETPYGALYPISYYAMVAQRYLHEYGGKREQLAEVAVAAREWAQLNPVAYKRTAGSLSVEDVVSAPVVSSPLGKLDCCLVTDAGGAVVVTARSRARDLRRPPVDILGYGELSTNASMTATDSLLHPGAEESGARAFRMAALTPADIDVAQLYDSFTITPVISLESLGFCGRGEALSFIADGRIRPGGDFPLNTSGGGLSYNHPGQFGVFLLIEAVRQLRGECGERQVANARTAVAHGTGAIFSHHATVVLGDGR